MDSANLRNFKDFLEIYNKMTESCFSKCITSLADRERSEAEIICVENCAQKHININQRIMRLYMNIQPEFMNRKIEEANKIQQQLMDKQEISKELSPNEAAVN